MKHQPTNAYYKEKKYTKLLLQRVKEGGVIFMLKEALEYFFDIFYQHFLFLKPKKYFSFNRKELQYVYHEYNKAWRNSRAVEVSIFLDLLKNYNNARILEVGHVLNHYSPFKHDIIDKYEYAEGIINEDIIKFTPKNKYDLIVSISTMEHVGVDDAPKDSSKAVAAIKNLKNNCLSENGSMIISIPPNYNPSLMKLVSENLSGKNFKSYFLKRTDIRKNIWKQCSFAEIKSVHPLEGLVLFEINSKTKII